MFFWLEIKENYSDASNQDVNPSCEICLLMYVTYQTRDLEENTETALQCSNLFVQQGHTRWPLLVI